jgi:hypothetical protein
MKRRITEPDRIKMPSFMYFEVPIVLLCAVPAIREDYNDTIPAL